MVAIKHPTYKSLLVVIILGLVPLNGTSQVDSLKNEFQKEFDAFSNSIQQDFDSFQRRNDSIFLEFLNQSWKSFDAFKSESAMKPKPKEQPVREKTEIKMQPIKPGDIRVPAESPVIKQETLDESAQPDPENYSGMSTVSLNFYGTEVMIIPPGETLPRLKQVSPLYFVEFFKEAAESSLLTDNIRYLIHQAEEMKLNDWGLVCLFKATAEELFQDPNEQTLFIWFGLIRCGYNVKTGYNNDRVYLLVPSEQDLYNTIYFDINNKIYFLLKLDGKDVDLQNLDAYEADYPGNEKEISLLLAQLPGLQPMKVERKIFNSQDMIIEVDQSLIDFFSNYPECDLIVSLSSPLSDIAVKSIKYVLQESLSGLSDPQKVDFLLKFLQYKFPYKTDEEQFGKENYLFPEEALFYPYTDCEDRAALFARLVEQLTSLEAIALCYPDHVTTAVNLPVETKGTYLDYNGQKYYICDPTYIGAEVGMSMPVYENVKPDIIGF